jgi:hypothetical protein
MRKPSLLILGLSLSTALWAAGPTPHKAVAAKGKAPATTPMTPSPEADPIEQLAVADKVHTGSMVCELGNTVSVTRDPQTPAGFVVQMRQHTFRMMPVVSHTGAVRLEDAQAGAMWLQLANKSMLMNSKVGQRMADDCQSPEQTAVAHAMKLSPPPSLLDDNQLAKK